MYTSILLTIAWASWIAGGVYFNLAIREFIVSQYRNPLAARHLVLSIALVLFGHIASNECTLEMSKN
jgi:hypothetical protein